MRSYPGAYSKAGKLETPQLLEIIFALGVPENFHSSPSLLNPADHNQE